MGWRGIISSSHRIHRLLLHPRAEKLLVTVCQPSRLERADPYRRAYGSRVYEIQSEQEEDHAGIKQRRLQRRFLAENA